MPSWIKFWTDLLYFGLKAFPLVVLTYTFLVLYDRINPKIDKTSEGDIILWYGKKVRRFIFLHKKR